MQRHCQPYQWQLDNRAARLTTNSGPIRHLALILTALSQQVHCTRALTAIYRVKPPTWKNQSDLAILAPKAQ